MGGARAAARRGGESRRCARGGRGGLPGNPGGGGGGGAGGGGGGGATSRKRDRSSSRAAGAPGRFACDVRPRRMRHCDVHATSLRGRGRYRELRNCAASPVACALAHRVP